MGSCYMRNCRCICQQNRISCQCGSQNTLLLENRREEQLRERTNQQMQRSNRFKQSIQKQNSQKKSHSKDSQDSMSKTKNSTNRRGGNSRSPQSIERQLMSDMCNLLSEQQEYKKKKIIVKIMDFPMKTKYFQEDQNINGVQSLQFLQQQQQQQQSSTENRATLDYIQSIKESLNKVKSESNTQKADSKASLGQSISIAQNLESPDKLSKPLTSVSVDNQPGSISQQTLLQINQVINRSKTAQDHIDESEQKSVTPRGVLKKAPDSDGSYRSVQIQQKNRKVRFDLPNSHYAKERARQQQHFYH